LAADEVAVALKTDVSLLVAVCDWSVPNGSVSACTLVSSDD
jgi:hypothetical protein